MKRVWAYSRVSTYKQLFSLESQQKFLENYCRQQKLFLHDIKSDIASGSFPERLYNLRLILDKIEPREVLLVRDVSRLGRDVYKVNDILEELHLKNSEVYSILDNVSSLEPEFLKRIEFAETELKINKERQRQRNLISQRQGTVIKINGIPKLFKLS